MHLTYRVAKTVACWLHAHNLDTCLVESRYNCWVLHTSYSSYDFLEKVKKSLTSQTGSNWLIQDAHIFDGYFVFLEILDPRVSSFADRLSEKPARSNSKATPTRSTPWLSPCIGSNWGNRATFSLTWCHAHCAAVGEYGWVSYNR